MKGVAPVKPVKGVRLSWTSKRIAHGTRAAKKRVPKKNAGLHSSDGKRILPPMKMLISWCQTCGTPICAHLEKSIAVGCQCSAGKERLCWYEVTVGRNMGTFR